MLSSYQEAFARRESKKSAVLSSTHLICPNPDTNSDKYRAACKWGKFAVVAEWLVECCAQKKIVSEAQYNPELESDSDSQSQSSYIMPKTPEVTNKGSTKAENPGGTSTVSVMASSVTRPTGFRTRFQNEDTLPSEDKSPFKPRTSVAKKNKKPYNFNSSEVLERELQNPAFLEYLEKQKAENGVNENRDIDAEVDAYLAKMDTSSFRAYKAEQRVLQGLPPEEQPSIEIEGMTTEEARDFRISLEVAGLNTPPPNLRKKPKKLPTPTSVMMKRTWKQIMEKFPITSTPKARKSSTSSVS